MAATTGIKFDDGSGHSITNCFPVRNYNSSGGAWVVEQKAEQRRRFKAVLCANPRTFEDIREERKKAERTGTDFQAPSVPPATSRKDNDDEDDIKILDGFFLLKHCFVEDPTDLCSVNISGCGLTDVKEDDLVLFDNVIYVNAADNVLQLESLKNFSMMRELELSLNGLRNIKISPENFNELRVLDVSYNNLSRDDILYLGVLRNLQVLHLSSNNIERLPLDMSRPFVIGQSSFKRFPNLEVLLLDDNSMSDMENFGPLAGLTELKELDLSRNKFEFVPHLLIAEGRHITKDSIPLNKSKSAREHTNGPDNKKQTCLSAPQSKAASSPSNPTPLRESLMGELEALDLNEVDEKIEQEEIEEQLKDSLPPPFLSLRLLNMGHNLITREEALMPVAAWPNVQELLVHGNPLVTEHSGDPALLKQFLVDHLGIQLIRKEPPKSIKPTIEIPTKKERFVSGKVRKVRKVPVEDLLAIEAPTPPLNLLSSPTKQPLPPIPQSPNTEENKQEHDEYYDDYEDYEEGSDVINYGDYRTPDSGPHTVEGQNLIGENGDAFFMTQLEEPIEELSEQGSGKRDDKERKNEKYKGQTPIKSDKEKLMELLEMTEDEQLAVDTVNLPDKSDVAANVRALNYLLNHPLQLKERNISLRRPQVPFRPEMKPRPPAEVNPRKSRLKQKEEALKQMKNRKTYKEAPLTDTLKDDKLAKDFPDAAKLLKRIERRYNKAKIDTMQEATELRSLVRSTIEKVAPPT
ncbi:DgyrCDS2958 [Dimorphilus gyrociliatus]|uniref:DgyrCDS2958 n=1 Tax=Dimorphilus gyrociliatus TaxID=2664684 RepID=A0A7I8VDN6_9ANNE|nr:DgyrCDS2958 [Dimorphilus gyrociliatus]